MNELMVAMIVVCFATTIVLGVIGVIMVLDYIRNGPNKYK